MLINDLPDDCLLTIFHLIDDFNDLINFSKVCFKWNQIVSYRLKSVKFALGPGKSNFPQSTVYMKMNPKITDIETLLPNLKILHLIGAHDTSLLRTFTRYNKSIIGLIIYEMFRDYFLSCRFQNLEIIVTDHLTVCLKNCEKSVRLKQIHSGFRLSISFDTLLKENFHNLENLERLHINGFIWSSNGYSGSKLANLKIIEIAIYSFTDSVGSHFMDFCPSLQSAYLYFPCTPHPGKVHIENTNLRDLVFDCNSEHRLRPSFNLQWDEARRILNKFPNLEHLAIRGSTISDDFIKELVHILPKVKLLDFRGSPEVTSRSADFLRKYCAISGRSIVMYHNCQGAEPKDWPKMIKTRDVIVHGLNFMAHCFFRRWPDLPNILYPYV